MPYLLLEHSEDIDAIDCLTQLHQLLGGIETIDIKKLKGRSVKHSPDHFIVGDGSSKTGFVYVQLSLLAGRSPALLQIIAEKASVFLKNFFRHSIEKGDRVTFEIREIMGPHISINEL
jgi:5-carboxymethyl-2-hydroxymuconate isomerase